MPKASFRRTLLERRKSLLLSQWHEASRFIQQTFMDMDLFKESRVLMLYAPVQNEVDTGSVLVRALALGKTVLYPAVIAEDLVFHRVTAVTDFEKGRFGILQPSQACPRYSPEEADLIVIPGVAFDLKGNRIGYGKGYYDRALHKLEGMRKLVAFCHDFQLIDEIVREPHDVKMDVVITENRVVIPSTELIID